jgi:hypothetical protein
MLKVTFIFRPHSYVKAYGLDLKGEVIMCGKTRHGNKYYVRTKKHGDIWLDEEILDYVTGG